METKKNIINDPMKVYSTTKRQEKRRSAPLHQVPLYFMGGCDIKELSYKEEYGYARRKVRRIIEKRVCQKLNNQMDNLDGNKMRFKERRQSGKYVKRICGSIPYAFSA